MLLSLSDNSEFESEKLEQLKRLVNTNGLFEVKDAKTGRVYIDNKNIKSVINKVHPQAGLVMTIDLDEEGKKILEDITSKYIRRPATEAEKNAYNKKHKGEKNVPPLEEKSAMITICIDGIPVSAGAFQEPIKNGEIIIPLIGDVSKLSQKQIMEAKIEAEELANILRSGAAPIKYVVYSETRLAPKMDSYNIRMLIYAAIAVVAISFVIAVVMYRLNGIISFILSLAYIFMIIIMYQYTNIAITIPSIVAILVLYILQYAFTLSVLKDVKGGKEIKILDSLGKMLKNSVILLIAGIILCFSKETEINSFGQMMIMGIILFAIFNILFTKNALMPLDSKKEKKDKKVNKEKEGKNKEDKKDKKKSKDIEEKKK